MPRRLQIALGWASLSLAAAMACADVVVVEPATYEQADVTRFSDQALTFRTAEGGWVIYPLKKIRRIQIDGLPVLNLAERAFANGRRDAAVNYYRMALEAGANDWQEKLIRARLAHAKTADPLPAHADAAEPSLVKHLESAASFAKLLEQAPSLPATQDPNAPKPSRSRSSRRFAKSLKAFRVWQSDQNLLGRDVEWTVRFRSIQRDGDAFGGTVVAEHDEAIRVEARLAGITPMPSDEPEPGARIRLRGRLYDYRPSERGLDQRPAEMRFTVLLKQASYKPAPRHVYDPGPATPTSGPEPQTQPANAAESQPGRSSAPDGRN